MRDRLALAGFKVRIKVGRRQVAQLDDRRRTLQMPEFAKFLGRHRYLVRPATSKDRDRRQLRILQRVERMRCDIRSGELHCRLRQNARHVERDIAVPDDHRPRPIERRRKVCEVGMTVVPADERRGAIDARQVCAWNIKATVGGGTGRKHHGIVRAGQFFDRDILPHGHTADEPRVGGQVHRLVPPLHGLDRLMVGRDARSDQPVWDGQAVDDVDPHIVPERFLCRFGCIIARRARSHDRDMSHGIPPLFGHCAAGDGACRGQLQMLLVAESLRRDRYRPS